MRTFSLERLQDRDATLEDAQVDTVSGDAELDRVVLWLDAVLDDSYMLLRNVDPPGAQATVDMLVLGPSGIWTLYIEGEPGQYRTEGGRFYAWETQAGGYVLIRPNPLLILKSTLTQLRGWMSRNGLPVQCVHSAILFTDSSAVIEAGDDDVRLVAPSLVEAYPLEIANAPAVLKPEEVERAVFAVARGELPEAPPILTHEEEEEEGLRLRLPLNFTLRQWIVLAVLAFLDVAVLGLFLLYAININR